MEIISAIFYFVIVLGILVFIHEFGHFIMARISGMRVETFSLGMGFRLFGWNKVNGFTFGNLDEKIDLGDHTDYRLAAFPIGGYCKISGMIDETLDTKAIAKPPQPYEFRAKGPFKKAITIVGGVLFNTLLAIVIFSILAFRNGETTFKTTTIGYVSDTSIAQRVGLLSGDKINAIDGKKLNSWNQLLLSLTENLGNDRKISITRNQIDTVITVNGKKLVDLISSNIPLGLEPDGLRTIIMSVQSNSLAEKAGIKSNDTIFSLDNTPIYSYTEFISEMQNRKNKLITLEWKHDKNTITKEIQLDNNGIIGVQIAQAYTGETIKTNYNILEAFVVGTKQTFETFRLIVSSIYQIIVGNLEFKKAIGGPIMIAQQATQFADRGFWSFLSFTAMLSISLALINILPLPALDGGHFLIIIIEAILRREISVKVKLVLQQIGLYLLMGLMIYVIINDILKLL